MVETALKIKGAYRLKIVDPDGHIAGDSGWHKNTIVNDGFKYFLVHALGAVAGSLQLSHMALGSGTAPAVTTSQIPGEVGTRTAITFSTTTAGSKTLVCYATFASGWHSSSGVGYTISNIGLYNSSSTGTLFAGSSYTGSACASNQSVQATYSLVFS